jgi:hypothetical protein
LAVPATKTRKPNKMNSLRIDSLHLKFPPLGLVL